MFHADRSYIQRTRLIHAEGLEDLAYLEAVYEVSWPGQMPVFRSGL